MAPTIWPHLRIESGPPCAGLEPGDVISFLARDNVYPGGYQWAGKNALHVWSARAHYTDAGCYRVNDDPVRLEHCDSAHQPWLAETDAVVDNGDWQMRFVVDGAPLGTVKRFGPHTAVHCTEVGRSASGHDDAIYSAWVLPADGGRDELHVIERPSGEIVYRVLPRSSKSAACSPADRSA